MADERGDEVAEEGLSVRGGAVQVPVFEGAAGHIGEVRTWDREVGLEKRGWWERLKLCRRDKLRIDEVE